MNRTKSPLKHEEGNALAHAPYADEASWHKKNDKKEVVKKEDVVKQEEVKIDDQEILGYNPDLTAPNLKNKVKEESIDVEGSILNKNFL